MAGANLERNIREARLLRDRLRTEGRHEDADTVQRVILSARNSAVMNERLARDAAELRKQIAE